MNTYLRLWLSATLFSIMLPALGAQQPSLVNQFYHPATWSNLNKFIFQSQCPEVVLSFDRENLSYGTLTVISAPEKFQQPFQRAYFDYLCRQLQMRHRLEKNMDGWYSVKVRSNSQKDAPTGSTHSVMFQKPLLYQPYDKFKSDLERLLNQEDDGWSVLGMMVLGLARDIWVWNR